MGKFWERGGLTDQQGCGMMGSCQKNLTSLGMSKMRQQRNGHGVETSASSYRSFMMDMLKKKPIITAKELEEAVIKNFRHTWGPDDLAPIKGKKTPKWKNNLDWAKVSARAKGLIYSRKALDQTYICCAVTCREMEWISSGCSKSSFTKQCKNCKITNKLSAKICEICATAFPIPSIKVQREPLQA